MDLTNAMEEYASKKSDRLSRFYDRIQDVDIVVDKPSHEFEVEVIAHVERHDPFIASCRGEDYYACVDDVVDKLTRQITDHKERLKDHRS